jgi:hypothetical protein
VDIADYDADEECDPDVTMRDPVSECQKPRQSVASWGATVFASHTAKP